LRGLELRKAVSYQSPPEGVESVILKMWRKNNVVTTDQC
jgi:hypothetical protein